MTNAVEQGDADTADSPVKKEIKTALRPLALAFLKEFDDDPGLSPEWLAARDAQRLRTRLQLRAARWCPTAVALLAGSALGVSHTPMVVKEIVGGLAGIAFGWALSTYLFQVRRSEAAYRILPKKER